jgi:hypothetical protein
MSLVNRANESIALSLYQGLDDDKKIYPAQIEVDADSDSSFDPPAWVYIARTDANHDSDTMKLTYHEAELLRDRLSLILGY